MGTAFIKVSYYGKIIFVSLVISFALLLLSACGGSKDDDPRTPDKNSETTQENGGTSAKDSEISQSGTLVKGADVSSLISLENSGVKYYDYDGNETDLLKLLSDCGFTHVRVRIWNDPYDKDRNGYGGGNCDLDNAAALGSRAAKEGLKLIADFHYSDFWADPSRQMTPKVMEGLSVSQKADYIREYTRTSLEALKNAGADTDMVQIGNETVYGMCGEDNWDNMIVLMKAGIEGARQADKNIKIILHFTDIQKEGHYDWIASMLKDNDVDYDIFATSYYPYWHGSQENMSKVLKKIADDHDKDVLVVETSYPYTTQDGDGFANSVGSMAGYEFSISEQINAISKTFDSVRAIGEHGLGVCYWEPAWIPVPGTQAEKKALWEKFGSGWASSYSAEYDPENAGKWYGGSSWDNQALFDNSGHPLESLKIFGGE